MLLLLALRRRLWLLLDWGLLRGLGRRAVAHLCSELLLGRGHLPLAASPHHASRLLAFRLGLCVARVCACIVVSCRGDSWSSVGPHDAHGAERGLLQGVNDIVSAGFNPSGCGPVRLLEVLDGEVNDRAANLHGFVETR